MYLVFGCFQPLGIVHILLRERGRASAAAFRRISAEKNNSQVSTRGGRDSLIRLLPVV